MVDSFYLKYRPQKSIDLDLTQVRDFFARILESGKVSHAYLFTGPRGSGKTSAARILAKLVNCDRNRDRKKKAMGEPCHRCKTCKAMMSGNWPDLVEIDAASNRGIDDIRSLREKIGLAPVGGGKKVYIIDEVHMLTTEAFNALLKTLEEPPEHAIFVLATTEPQKVPETIKSRCVNLRFYKASGQEVIRSLKKVVSGEGLKIGEDVLEEIARSVDGSFREGMKILEQLASAGGKITLKKVQLELGKGGFGKSEFLQSLLDKDIKKAIDELGSLEKQGVNWRNFVVELVEEVRRELLGRIGIDIDRQRADFLKTVDTQELMALVQQLVKAGKDMRGAMVEQLPLEILAMRWADEGGKEQRAEKKVQEVKRVREVSEKQKKVMMKARVAGKVSLEKIASGWQDLLKAVRPHNHSLEGLLRSTRPVDVDGDRVIVDVFYQFHMDQLSQERFLKIVENELLGLFGQKLRLDYRLGKKPRLNGGSTEVENISGEVADEDVVKIAEEVFGIE